MNYGDISRKFLMELIDKVEKKIWEEYTSYENVTYYIEKWHEDDEDYASYNHWENFYIQYKDDEHKQINLKATLHKMPPEIIVKIAIELGIDTPGFLPAMPTFKNVLRDENQSAYQNFDRATKSALEHPDNAVALASSTLEGIIKTILEHDAFSGSTEKLKNLSLSRLTARVVKEFGFDDATKCPPEIITLAGQLRGIAVTVDDLRSDKSTAHGKSGKDYVIDDPLWAIFTINTCATLGLFLWEYFEKKYLPQKQEIAKPVDERSIDLSEIPF